MTRGEFLSEVESYLSKSGMAPTTFGMKALNDPSFVSDLRNGRSPSLTSVERVMGFMTQQPPVEAA